MRIELEHASAQATIEREQTREQAVLDRQHDANEAHRERITTARRTAYLEAIGELVKTQLFLGGLAKQDLAKLDAATGLGGLLTAVAKISILGEMATIAKSRALISLINQIFFKGLATTLPLTKVKHSIAFNDERYAATQFDIERILSAMKNHNETLVNDKPGFDALQRSFGDQQFAAERYSAESVKARLAFADGEKKYGMELIEEMKIVTNRCDELICAIREELGLAYQVGATQFLGYDAGLFTFYVATSPEQAELARRELLAEIAKIAAHGIPDEAFDRVRSTVLSGLAIQQQSPASVARHVALDLLFGHAADQHRLLPAAYNGLTAERVRETAARLFSVKPTVVTVLPE